MRRRGEERGEETDLSSGWRLDAAQRELELGDHVVILGPFAEGRGIKQQITDEDVCLPVHTLLREGS